MIVKDEKTLKDALQMLKAAPHGVRYSDQGDEHGMESHPKALHAFRLECTRVRRRQKPALATPYKD